jgi:hypothetical protein
MLISQLLQGAVAMLITGGAIAAVSSQQQLNDQLSVLAQTLGMGENHHAVTGFLGAGSEQTAAIILDGTQTAGTEDGKLRLVAQSGNFNTGIADDGQNISFVGKLVLFTVNSNNAHDFPSLCFNIDGIEGAVGTASVALDALGGIDGVRLLDNAGNRIDRAVSSNYNDSTEIT